MRPAVRRAIFLIALGLLVAGALVYAFIPRPLPVDLAEIRRGPLVVTADDEGKTRVKEVYAVSAPLAGRIERVEVHAGDGVTAGQTLLAQIRPLVSPFLDPRARAQAEAAERAAAAARDLAAAELDRARSDLVFAESEYKRVSELAAHGTASRRAADLAAADRDARRAAVASARAALRVRDHELQTARAALADPTLAGGRAGCCVDVRSPVDGRVLRVLQESEAVVPGGAVLMEVGDPAELEIAAEMLSSDAVRIRAGAPVFIEDWGGPVLHGHVRRVEPFGFTKISALGVEEQRVIVVIDFDDPPAVYARLGHGYRVDVRVVVWQAADVLTAPAGGLFRQGDQWAAFVVKDGRARLQTVSVGQSNGREFEVTGGLGEHQQIILHPSDRISEGRTVVPRQ